MTKAVMVPLTEGTAPTAASSCFALLAVFARPGQSEVTRTV